jgi:hypothetical protein
MVGIALASTESVAVGDGIKVVVIEPVQVHTTTLEISPSHDHRGITAFADFIIQVTIKAQDIHGDQQYANAPLPHH